MQTCDADFETWLQSLSGRGYPRIWIANNLDALRRRYNERPGEQMPECPEPSRPTYDPYRGL
ncbi:hypothetical protein LH128_01172 [Sphingomonas sp. LH128]|nr:hypothetical protein LH128_01172 [Sphingomonas sp. LH128]